MSRVTSRAEDVFLPILTTYNSTARLNRGMDPGKQ